MANQNTTLRVGKANALVALMKMAGKPTEAKHDVRRVKAEQPEPSSVSAPVEVERDEPVSVFAPEPSAPLAEDPFARDTPEPEEPSNDAFGRNYVEPVAVATKSVYEDEERVPDIIQHGVWRDNEWVDLTDILETIDSETKIDGMLLEASMAQSSIPREHVRDSFYVLPKNPAAHKFCALVWHGLRESNKSAIVRWSKKTNQFLGMVVARGNRNGRGKNAPHLILIQLEWPENIRTAPTSAFLDMGLIPSAKAAENSTRAMENLEVGTEYVAGLKDERNGQRADVLNAARDGRSYAMPKSKKRDEIDALEAALTEALS